MLNAIQNEYGCKTVKQRREETEIFNRKMENDKKMSMINSEDKEITN